VARPFDDATSLYVAGCVFDALAAAHAAIDDAGEAAPVIHRDVKSLERAGELDGQVKLATSGSRRSPA